MSDVLTKQDLIDDLASGCKPVEQFRIGTEHEQFVFLPNDQRASYSGTQSIEAILTAMQDFGWQPVFENGKVIALKSSTTEATISLEPGGQFELSGAPLKTLHDTHFELTTHQQQLAIIAKQLDIRFQAVGFDPYNRREDIPWMPKARYEIMKRYMPTKGKLGLDMMTRTCTVQVNLDYESEVDMVTKMRLSMALQPFVTALFANSSWVEGKQTEYQSYRAQIWQDTDPDRCGLLPFVFEKSMGFECYVDYMLKVPMYFVKRDGHYTLPLSRIGIEKFRKLRSSSSNLRSGARSLFSAPILETVWVYINAAGQSFHDFMKGQLPALPGEYPILSDWHDHLTVAFPEVRLKHYLEMRGADSGPTEFLIGLPALWVGLLYDSDSLKALTALTANWKYEELKTLYSQVPKQGMTAQFKGLTLKEWLKRIVQISRQGLENRKCLNSKGQSEAIYLEPLIELKGLSSSVINSA